SGGGANIIKPGAISASSLAICTPCPLLPGVSGANQKNFRGLTADWGAAPNPGAGLVLSLVRMDVVFPLKLLMLTFAGADTGGSPGRATITAISNIHRRSSCLPQP